jgi:hypothetical protein
LRSMRVQLHALCRPSTRVRPPQEAGDAACGGHRRAPHQGRTPVDGRPRIPDPLRSSSRMLLAYTRAVSPALADCELTHLERPSTCLCGRRTRVLRGAARASAPPYAAFRPNPTCRTPCSSRTSRSRSTRSSS